MSYRRQKCPNAGCNHYCFKWQVVWSHYSANSMCQTSEYKVIFIFHSQPHLISVSLCAHQVIHTILFSLSLLHTMSCTSDTSYTCCQSHDMACATNNRPHPPDFYCVRLTSPKHDISNYLISPGHHHRKGGGRNMNVGWVNGAFITFQTRRLADTWA